MSDYRPGGFIPGPPARVTLEPDECVVWPSDPYTCIRSDHDHSDKET